MHILSSGFKRDYEERVGPFLWQVGYIFLISYVNILEMDFVDILYFFSESKFNLDKNDFLFPMYMYIFKPLLQEMHQACRQRLIQWHMFRSAREYMRTCAFTLYMRLCIYLLIPSLSACMSEQNNS